ncbi:class I SAM-dependent methyltransferase [Candidatus Dependentiae bacterium]|nr:class I SAM-dependent methyltransferase [Candidatus Dependentiae bacterium]
MKITDYSKIADKYDGNRIRQDLKTDETLLKFLKDSKNQDFNILDLGCGTGNYLKVHTELLKSYNINWYGLDLSEDMLRVAKQKVPEVKFYNGSASVLPYINDKFDYIVNNFAFHHFDKKLKALKEVTRCLKSNGVFRLKDIDPYKMPGWWVYKYFPSTYQIDTDRFWESNRILTILKDLGFKVEINVEQNECETELEQIIQDTENRDISELTLITEEEYIKGLETLKIILKEKGTKTITDELALVTITGKK